MAPAATSDSPQVEVDTPDGTAFIQYEVWPGRTEGSKVVKLVIQHEHGAPATRYAANSAEAKKLLDKYPDAKNLPVPSIKADEAEGTEAGAASAAQVAELQAAVNLLTQRLAAQPEPAPAPAPVDSLQSGEAQ